MEIMSQKCAVYAAITGVLKEKGISFEDGTDVSKVLTAEMRAVVIQMLVVGFQEGKVQMVNSQGDKLKGYVGGLVSNWIRKDKRFNGGMKYEAKNPGSRAGASDPELKNLMLLMSTLPEGADREEVAGFIKARKTELESAKSKPAAIDFSKLPEALKAKYSK